MEKPVYKILTNNNIFQEFIEFKKEGQINETVGWDTSFKVIFIFMIILLAYPPCFALGHDVR